MRVSAEQRLRAVFRNSLRRGFIKNAEIDPPTPPALEDVREPDEKFVVKIESTQGRKYWLSDRRLFAQDEAEISELFRYDDIRQAHWMFRDLKERLIGGSDSAGDLKTKYFDRLEIELPSRVIVLDGLGQSYSPTLSFFWWVIRSRVPRVSA